MPVVASVYPQIGASESSYEREISGRAPQNFSKRHILYHGHFNFNQISLMHLLDKYLIRS